MDTPEPQRDIQIEEPGKGFANEYKHMMSEFETIKRQLGELPKTGSDDDEPVLKRASEMMGEIIALLDLGHVYLDWERNP